MSRPVVIVGWWPRRMSAELSAVYCGDGLGWTVRDLFGLADVPSWPASNYPRLSRYDQTGLVWFLQGRQVLALTEDTAVIEIGHGTLSYRLCNKPALGPLGDGLVDFWSGSL
jgi:hypothetical protein